MEDALQPALAIFGALILVTVLLEVLWTTMGIGGGAITKRISNALWKGIVGLYRTREQRLILTWSGIAILLLAFVLWVLLLWTGWTLVFHGAETAVVHSQTGAPADFWERVYFTGFTIFTLGTGDFVPEGDMWRVLTAVASLNGLFLVTFSITYLVPIVQAATHVRQIAVYVSSLGLTPHAIIVNAWNGDNCCGLESHLDTLALELTRIEQRYLTYPVLHYFHTPDPPESLALSVAALDETLTMLQHAVEDRGGIDPVSYRATRQVITEFLDTLQDAFVKAADEAPPAPSLDPLRERGIPVVDSTLFDRRIEALADRRRLLRGLVQNSGWTWDEMRLREQSHSPTVPLTGV